jgi:hypothetical protein
MVGRSVEQIDSLRQPQFVAVRGCEPYELTYSYSLSRVPTRLAGLAIEGAEALLRHSPGRRLRFFTGLLDPPISSRILHKLFALLRAGVVVLQGDRRSALHSAANPARSDLGFALHADLFLTERVWLVFDDVPRGGSGKSLFLPRLSLVRTMRTIPSISDDVCRRICGLLDGGYDRDAFDESFDLLWSPRHAWTEQLRAALEAQTWAIKLRRGEGYLLSDRCWLHGRTAVRGRLSSGRFRRLVYGLESRPAR